ncbi:hypothetical protein GCM10009000_067060 [Halobacterium noricense]|uniref:Transposase n=1 Tax=Haladaptatus pallidirubidus TaxID=1008152 RepID=A0AAV3UKJ1_9EURY
MNLNNLLCEIDKILTNKYLTELGILRALFANNLSIAERKRFACDGTTVNYDGRVGAVGSRQEDRSSQNTPQ